jgi:hypothetical protein
MNTKSLQINAMILAKFRSNGGDFRTAFDEVRGEGAYSKLASEIYDALRAKQQ